MKVRDPCMPEQPAAARNYFLACYAVSLIQGQTILGSPIRLQTVKNYLSAAYDLFRDRKIYFGSDEDYIHIILEALRDYESVPKRRHMISDGMMYWLQRQAERADSDSKLAAIVDWIILGRYTGFRRSEWCQTSQSKYERIKSWPGRPSLAFIRQDFTFLGKNEELLDPSHADFSWSMVYYVKITWRKQKNKRNNQSITYARDNITPKFCPVEAAIRIYIRSLRLGVPDHQPMGVCAKDGKCQRCFITDSMVADLLREAAATVLNVPRNSDYIKQWSTHSIRVTAANLLHRQKFSDSFIQTRLRWTSKSFLDYLRNTIYGAEQHSKALNISESNLPPPHERVYREPEPHERLLAPAA